MQNSLSQPESFIVHHHHHRIIIHHYHHHPYSHLLRPVRDVLVPGAGPRHVRDLEPLLLARVRGLQLRVGAGGEGAGAVTAARPLLAVQLLGGITYHCAELWRGY